MSEVSVSNLQYRYPHSMEPTLKGVDLEVEKGEFVFITGRSGCGKSTLARTLNGTIPHILGGEMDGQVRVKGKNTMEHLVSEIAPDLGFIFQNPESQFFTLRVEDEVAFGPENMGLTSNEIDKRVSNALDYVKMSLWRKRNVFQLSEGQKQRVAIAANLALDPDILVLDEPTSNLDLQGAVELFQVLEKLKTQGKTMILIDHRTWHARKLADRLVIMGGGKIIREGSPDLLDDPQLRAQYSIRNPNHTNRKNDLSIKTISNLNPLKPFVLSVENLRYQYGNGFSFGPVSFSISPGEVVGIMGPNGSGKTTLANLLAGLIRPTSGRINFTEEESLPTARKIGMVLQNPDHQLFMDRVYTELSFGLLELGFDDKQIKVRVEKVLNSMNLNQLRERHPHSLSGGEKQRTLISALMTRKPSVLVLDEPTTGMDDYHMEQLVKEVNNLQKSGVAVLLISHDLEFIYRSAHRVISMIEGQITEIKSI
ncbi:MAG: energy-coupling factor transporter ATPase [Methanobacteriaceae archaeon]|nr:energy-coupling factor transporter ATPase [Methanobacteriaceae archaeon]